MRTRSLAETFCDKCEALGCSEVARRMRAADYLSLVRRAQAPSASFFESGSDFRRDFDGFWRVSGSGNKTSRWRDVYYGLFSEVAAQDLARVRFPEVLCELYLRLKARGERTRVEPVFVSKMLATLDPSRAVWDRVVEDVLRRRGLLDIPKTDGKDADERLALSIKGYRMLADFLDGLLASGEGRLCIVAFDERIGPQPELSEMKKLDYVLWTLGGNG